MVRYLAGGCWPLAVLAEGDRVLLASFWVSFVLFHTPTIDCHNIEALYLPSTACVVCGTASEPKSLAQPSSTLPTPPSQGVVLPGTRLVSLGTHRPAESNIRTARLYTAPK